MGTEPSQGLTPSAAAILKLLQESTDSLPEAVAAAQILMLDLDRQLEAEWLALELKGFLRPSTDTNVPAPQRLGHLLPPGPAGDRIRKVIASYRAQLGNFTIYGPGGEAEVFPYLWFFHDPLRELVRYDRRVLGRPFSLHLPRDHVLLPAAAELMDLLHLTVLTVTFPGDAVPRLLQGLRGALQTAILDACGAK